MSMSLTPTKIDWLEATSFSTSVAWNDDAVVVPLSVAGNQRDAEAVQMLLDAGARVDAG